MKSYSIEKRKDNKPGNAIVIIINSLYPGGAERLVIDDINMLLDRDVDVRLITLRAEKPGASFADALHKSHLQWQTICFQNLFDFFAWIRLWRLLYSWHPRAVVTHLWLANTVGRITAWLAGVRMIVAFEQNVYERTKSRRHFRVDWLLAKISTHIVAVTYEARNSLIRHGIPERKISVISSAINIRRYERLESKGIRTKLGYPERAFIFIWIGRFIRQKAVDVLLRAFAKLQNGLLILVGDGEEREILQQLAAELHIEKQVRFLGFQNDVREFLAAGDCFVLPSRWEGLPVALLEAMAAGKPIIAGDIEGIREAVTQAKNAILVRPDDVESLAAAMRSMMADNALRARLSQASIIRAKDFSIESHTDQLLKLLGYS
ncbi:MAG: glycosyltransferase [bacterium]|nr:glycosyltransferase [bacterium]